MPSDPPQAAIARAIRPFRASDTKPILAILRDSTEASQWPAQSYVTLASSPGGLVLISEVQANAQLVGFLAARQVVSDAEILNVAVHPEFRRLGVASELLLASLEEFHKSAAAQVFLELRESNLAARALYLRHGFVPSGRRKGYYQQPPEDALCMHKKLRDVSL